MKKYLSCILMLSLSAIFTACNNGGSNTTNKDTTTTADTATAHADTAATATPLAPADSATSAFMKKVASGGLTEVHLGQMAKEKAKSERVKNFGDMMVTDHSRANDELKSLAAQKNVSLPTSPAAAQQRHIDELGKKTGAEFDKAYMKMMVEDHEKTIADFKKDSSSGTDPDVKAWSAKTLPTLRKHLDSARAIRKQL